MTIASAITPRVQASDTERFEVSGVAGRDSLAGGLGDRRDQSMHPAVVTSAFGGLGALRSAGSMAWGVGRAVARVPESGCARRCEGLPAVAG